MGKIKVLHTKYKLSSDGATSVLLNFATELKEEVQFDFLLYSKEGNDWAWKFKELGSHIFIGEVKGNNFFSREFQRVRLYIGFLKTHDYDVVHVDTDAFERVDVLLCAWLCGIKKRIYHSHNSRRESEANLAKIPAVKWLLQQLIVHISTDLLACSTEAAKWLFPAKYLSKVKILKNGIYAERFKFNINAREVIREQYKLNDCFVIGCVARFVEQKNYSFLIDIFAEVVKEDSNARLLLIGDGDLKDNIVQKVNNLNLEKQVIFVGTVDNVEDFMSAMDIYVMPSLFEGLSLVLLEAQASGLYCFTSSNVSRETKVSNRMEFISLCNDAKYWRDQILSKNFYDNLSCREGAWKDIINAGFDVAETSRELLKIYESNN